MPKFTVEHTCSLPAPDALSKIKTFFETDQDIRRIDPKIQCQFVESDMKGNVTGSQFKAEVKVKADGGGSKVSVMIDLPLLLTPFKGKVEETIKKKLSKYLA
jgi:hypothetical protein